MRQLKFRSWNEITMSFWYCNPIEGTEELGFDWNDNVMQFTGLLDRQGVEIYEGDIVKYGVFALNDRRNFGKTPWENLPDGVKEDDITFIINTFIVEYDIQFLEKLRVAITSNPDVQGVEVIGNIHENGDLRETH